MKVYVLSYYSNGEHEATDGVYGVFSSVIKAWKQIDKFVSDFNETIYDFDLNMETQTIYTDKGTYLIEIMTLDEEC